MTCMYVHIYTSIAVEGDGSIQNSCQHQNQSPMMVTASMLGLVSFILLLVALVAGIYISYRLCDKHDRKATRYRFLTLYIKRLSKMHECSPRPTQVPVYEMVDMPPQDNSSS